MEIIILALVTGITSGGLSCLAVQGGLLASTLSTQKEATNKNVVVGTFLGAKLIAYTLLGFLLGLIGSSLTISPQVQGWMQIAAGIFMLLTVGRMLDIHPIFRRFVIQPPKAIYKLLKKESTNEGLLSPALLGFLTVLIPCGITQGMIVYAIASANPITGAAIMFAYTLGTTPVFFILGVSAAHLLKKKSFNFIAAFVIFLLGLISINTGQVLRGSSHTLQNYAHALGSSTTGPISAGKIAEVNSEGFQEVTINVLSNGYVSDVNSIKAGIPTRLKLITKDTLGCSRAFMIPKLGYRVTLPLTGEETFEFTPEEKGTLSYTCSMGMYGGRLQII